MGAPAKYYLRGLRGSGKTYTANEVLADLIVKLGTAPRGGLDRDYAIIGPTFEYAREILLGGPESGLLAALARRREYLYAHHAAAVSPTSPLYLPSGDRLFVCGIDQPRHYEGRNFSAVLCDDISIEPEAWQAINGDDFQNAVRAAPALQLFAGSPTPASELDAQLLADPSVRTIEISTHLTRAQAGLVLKPFVEPSVYLQWAADQ